MTRSWRYAILGFTAFVGIAVFLPVEQHYRGKSALAAYRRGLAARGERLTAEELKPPFVRPEDNGAELLLGGAQTLNANPDVQLSFPPREKVMMPGKWLALPPLNDWSGLADRGYGTPTNMNWANTANEIALASNSFAAIHAGLKRPSLYFPQTLGAGPSPDWMHLSTVRKAVSWLTISAMLHLHEGRREGALEDLEAACAVIHRQATEPYLIDQMVRDVECINVFAAAWQALQFPGWTDAELARLQRAWEPLSFGTEMLVALEVERLWDGAEFDKLRTDPKMFAGLLVKPDKPDVSGNVFEGAWYWKEEHVRPIFDQSFRHPYWVFARSDQAELQLLQMLQVLIDQERAGVTNRNLLKSGARHTANDEWIMDALKRPAEGTDILGMFGWMGNLMGAVPRAMQCETYREMVVTAIALERFRMRHGRYPETLAALIPEVIAQMPHDYLDGQPLRYRLKPDGHFLLYSVGFDGKDDGGDPRPPDSFTGTSSFARGKDLVWPEAATDGEIEEYKLKAMKKK
jgi:hypothetical protein